MIVSDDSTLAFNKEKENRRYDEFLPVFCECQKNKDEDFYVIEINKRARL